MLTETKINPLQKVYLDRFEKLSARFQEYKKSPDKSPLDLNLVFALFPRAVKTIRLDLIELGLHPLKAAVLTEFDNKLLEEDRIEESRRTGVIFQADKYLSKNTK